MTSYTVSSFFTITVLARRENLASGTARQPTPCRCGWRFPSYEIDNELFLSDLSCVPRHLRPLKAFTF